MTTLGKRIQDLRKKKDLSLFQLSHKCGMREQTLRYWENDERNPSNVGSLALVAQTLGTTTDYLITGKAPTLKVSAQC